MRRRGDLVEMKRHAGRPQDLADLAGLEGSGEGHGEPRREAPLDAVSITMEVAGRW